MTIEIPARLCYPHPMVSTAATYDFSTVIDGFFAQKKIHGPHSALITATIRERALNLLSHEDVRYMPAFKILDMLAALVTMGVAIAEATQLRPVEIRALLRESLGDGTALIRQFMLEAALERARYEPLMLPDSPSTANERDIILQRRWAAMRAAHQENPSCRMSGWMRSTPPSNSPSPRAILRASGRAPCSNCLLKC